MNLNGIATAIYGTAEKSTFSLAALSAENGDEIYIDSAEKIEINPADTAAAREVFLRLLNLTCTYKAQVIKISENEEVQVPVPVVHGVADNHPQEAYLSMLRGAFPEYLNNDPAIKHETSVRKLMEHLCLEYFNEHASYTKGENPPKIQMYDFGLYQSEEVIQKKVHVPTPRETQLHLRLSQLIDKAMRDDDEDALNELRLHAERKAKSTATQLREEQALGDTRFVQIGLHKPECQNNATYTYLEVLGLRDIFAKRLITYLPVSQNICIKTPNAKPSPAFSDITATILADTWDQIVHLRTKVKPKKRHVEAKMR